MVYGATTVADLEQLYLDHRHDAIETARHQGARADAEDFVQDAFVRLLTARAFLRSASPKYLYLVTRGIAIRQVQRRARVVLASEDLLDVIQVYRQRQEYGRRIAPPPRRLDTMKWCRPVGDIRDIIAADQAGRYRPRVLSLPRPTGDE